MAAKQVSEKTKEEAKKRAAQERPDDGETTRAKTRKRPTAAQKKSVKGLRIGAVVLWILAIATEVAAFFALRYVIANNAQQWTDPECLMLIGALVLDAIFCVIAALLWKSANRIRPSLADSKLVRTLWHQLGVIMVLVCFLPIGIYLLSRYKELDGKLRAILLALCALLMVGATATSVDYNQPSEAEVQQLQEEAKQEIGDGDVIWTRFGKSYHFDENCQSLQRSNPDNLFSGSLDDAFAANRWDPCDFCAGGAE